MKPRPGRTEPERSDNQKRASVTQDERENAEKLLAQAARKSEAQKKNKRKTNPASRKSLGRQIRKRGAQKPISGETPPSDNKKRTGTIDSEQQNQRTGNRTGRTAVSRRIEDRNLAA
jgi:hypothetical protein